MISFKRALKIAHEKEFYELCKNPAHGYREPCTYNGKTAPARVVICPIIQFYPRPSFLFHSQLDFRRASDKDYRKRGWIK